MIIAIKNIFHKLKTNMKCKSLFILINFWNSKHLNKKFFNCQNIKSLNEVNFENLNLNFHNKNQL
jgi:hypothetical protein